MNIQQAVENQSHVLRGIATSVQNAKSNGNPVDLSVEYDGYLISIKFIWDNDILYHEIIIEPLGNNISDKDFIQTLDTEYISFWATKIHFEFQIRRLIIKEFKHKFNKDFSLRHIKIYDRLNQGSIIISDCYVHITIDGGLLSLSGVSSDYSRFLGQSSLSINDSRIGKLNVEDSQLFNAIKLRGDKISLEGKIIECHLIESECVTCYLTECSFDKVRIEKSTIETLQLEELNKNKLKGIIEIDDSKFIGHFEITRVILGDSVESGLGVDKINHFQLNPIYLEINGPGFYPKSISTNEVTWNYNGVITNEKFAETKRRLINLLKNYYVQNDDILNSQLQYAFEKKWYLENYKANIPLRLSNWSNNFGLSIRKPLLLILLVIMIESLLLYLMANNCRNVLIEKWGVFFYLMNPTHSTSIFIEVFKPFQPPIMYSNLLPLIDNLGRIVIGYLIFQFANAFRYKFKLR